jgi:DNA repair exonuclease SbcCD ATPase subunit
MIIEGFEIENWTCIKKLTVSGLPATGVIVLHGPNRTGKSSLVKALRACLMDYSSTSTALKTSYPRGSGEKPTVTVKFIVGGTSYRIKKCFGSNKSELASRTSTGDWRVETATAAEAHSRVCELVGGDDSGKGLRQLLWLTQAEFRLPDPKKFDASVQAQLRGVLGVLQTPLDDRFIDRVRKRWNEWYSGQRKAGKQHQIKDGCRLAQNLGRLVGAQADLEKCETRFNELEGQLRQTSELEARRLDLDRQLREQSSEFRRCQEERERSQARISARKLAEERHSSAEKEQTAALEEQQQRTEAAQRLIEAQDAVLPAKRNVDLFEQIVQALVVKQAQRKTALSGRRNEQRVLQQRANAVTTKLRAMDDMEKLNIARNALQRAQSIAQSVVATKAYLAQHPVPDKKKLEELKASRLKILQLQADRDAASMILRIVPAEGADAAQLAVDDGPLRWLPSSPAPPAYSVRRKAELDIPAWGRVELSRGTSSGDLNQIEADLRQCHEEYAVALASFGISANDADAFDQLLRRIAEHALKTTEVQNQEQELKKFAPQGLAPLQRSVLELEAKVKDVAATDSEGAGAVPSDRDGLEKLGADLNTGIGVLNGQIADLEKDLEEVEENRTQGLADVTRAKERLAGFYATTNGRQEEVGRLRTEEQIVGRVDQANQKVTAAKDELMRSELTLEESTVDGRLAASDAAVNALENQIRETDEKYNRIKGRLEGSEGLHPERAGLGARVDELARITKRESIEKDAVDRLFELFDDCREKQLGTLMGPIHDRVLNWMRVLEIGDYKEVRFGDAFLPDKLVRRDGTAEFAIDEESTGAQEQIGMLVRVALGSLLTSAAEPAVAILDDPLTHCDVGRLNKMRVILRRAAGGDSKVTPPAGPLQIIILTCHPEWFRDDQATVIDLENPEVMQRFAV